MRPPCPSSFLRPLAALALTTALHLPAAAARAEQPPALAPLAPSAPLRVHSPALMAGGIVLTTFGAASLAGGLAAIVEGSRNGPTTLAPLAIGVGIPLLVHAAGCLGGGIPMIVIGARKIPAPIPVVLPVRGGVALGLELGLVSSLQR